MPDRLLVEKNGGIAHKSLRKAIPLLQSTKLRKASLIKRVASLSLVAAVLVYIGQLLLHQSWLRQEPGRKTVTAHIPDRCQSQHLFLSRSPPSLACRIEHAIAYHQQRLARQSRTVEEAMITYEKRYKRKPPKHFETWVEFALEHHSPLIDDYDQIDIDMAPFRKQKAVKSAEWRHRMSMVKRAEPGEMLGSVSFIDGAVTAMGPEAGSMSSGTLEGLLQPIAPLLPDMTILYNWYAEPRLLSSRGKQQQGPPSGGNEFRIIRQRDDEVWHETSHDTFGNFTQRKTVDLLAQSCPSTTLAGVSFLSSIGARNLCNLLKKKLSIDTMHGFFAAPDAFLPTYTLVPLLSRAKLSIFDDILAPNVCYGHQDYRYWNEYDTMPFSGKSRSVYWRGSMTGISTTSTNWVNGHRHRLVGYVQAIRAYIDAQRGKDVSKILSPSASLEDHLGKAPWTPEVRRALSRTSSDTFDVAFVASPPKCPKEVCNAIKEEMPFQKEELVDASFQHQYVLDLDGQSMSCRFYSLLESNSVVLKQTIWGEWHDERLIPWLHYVPIDIDLSKHEIPLYLDWFINTSEGRRYGDIIAKESRKWAEASLRKIDLTIYLFRLFIELAEVMSVG